jgi:hypothetical protein
MQYFLIRAKVSRSAEYTYLRILNGRRIFRYGHHVTGTVDRGGHILREDATRFTWAELEKLFPMVLIRHHEANGNTWIEDICVVPEGEI